MAFFHKLKTQKLTPKGLHCLLQKSLFIEDAVIGKIKIPDADIELRMSLFVKFLTFLYFCIIKQQKLKLVGEKQPYIIGITGGSGSGKTTFLHLLTELFSKEEVCVVSQDDYYFPREAQKADEKGIKNFDLPTSIDSVSLQEDLSKMLEGEAVTREEYTFNNKLKEPKIITFNPAPVIILEGLFIFHYKEIKEKIDLKLFVDAKDTYKVVRRIARDRVERNYPLDDVLYRYQNHVMPAFERFILPYKDEADLVVNNNGTGFGQALDVVAGFIRSKLLTRERS